MRQSIIGTSEIALSVADLPAMRHFYVNVLGFPLHREARINPMKTAFPDLSAKAIFIQDPEGNTIELICHDEHLPKQ